MKKCKFTKKYFHNQIVMFRYSCRFYVVEKFYHIEDDYETDAYKTIDGTSEDAYKIIDDKSDKAIMSIHYNAMRNMDNQKIYYHAFVNTAFGGFKMEHFSQTTRLDRIRNKVFKTILDKLYSLQIVSLNLEVK